MWCDLYYTTHFKFRLMNYCFELSTTAQKNRMRQIAKCEPVFNENLKARSQNAISCTQLLSNPLIRDILLLNQPLMKVLRPVHTMQLVVQNSFQINWFVIYYFELSTIAQKNHIIQIVKCEPAFNESLMARSHNAISCTQLLSNPLIRDILLNLSSVQKHKRIVSYKS